MTTSRIRRFIAAILLLAMMISSVLLSIPKTQVFAQETYEDSSDVIFAPYIFPYQPDRPIE